MNGMLDKIKNSPHRKKAKDIHPSEMEETNQTLLEKKLQMKTQALLILSQDLEECKMQRDRFRLMAEQLQEDLNRRIEIELNNPKNIFDSSNIDQEYKSHKLDDDAKLLDLLIEAKEKNKCLQLQVDTLRQKLKEAQEDIKILRSAKSQNNCVNDITPQIHQREELVEQLEQLHVKCKQLKIDLQSVIDEKQELETERDAYKCKAHRLNHELSKALNASKPVDIDALLNENRFLQERIQQLHEEKDLARQSVQKYKSMLDNKRQKGTIKLGNNNTIGSVMTFKQVEQLLRQGPNITPQKSAAALAELHSVCTALLEALNDKSLALTHQKKANKILASRICELESTMESPTMKLLDGYTSADVDARCISPSITSDISEEHFEDKSADFHIDGNDIEESIKQLTPDGCESMKSNSEENSSQCTKSNGEESESSSGKIISENSEPVSIDKPILEEIPICKNVAYYAGTKSFKKYNFEESLKASLPEYLGIMVLKAVDDIKTQDQMKKN